MLRRLAIATVLFGLAACAGVAPAGRNAERALPPANVEPAPIPEPQPAARPQAPAQVAAPEVSVSPPRSARRPSDDDNTVVVPGQVENQVPPPNGDPRNRIERMQDVRAWDRCVSHVQAVFEQDPMRPQLESPEDVCRQSLGMTSRNAVPESRLRRR